MKKDSRQAIDVKQALRGRQPTRICSISILCEKKKTKKFVLFLPRIHLGFRVKLIGPLGTTFRATGVDVVWPDFGVDSVYPPPDTPPEEGGLADD